ncbi:MAG: bifunctional demethylmenaquinone methyltransferase/2-methoxy-6-polyprenyl-1,4-benzoquinol methylase UbiE [Kofleriaceae bacterium]
MTEMIKSESQAALGSGQMFDRIAPRYDFVNRVLSLGLDKRWRRRVIHELALAPNARVLDVATGTGDLAIELAKAVPAGKVIGLDPSPNMLAVATLKLAKRGLEARVELIEGDAQALPQANCEIDAATIAFGIRNVPDRPRALRELARVVRPGGTIAVLELGEPKRGLFGRAARFHTRQLVPRIGALLSGRREYRYLQTSVAAFPAADEFAQIMRDNGLAVRKVIPLTFGVCTLFIASPQEDA